jgi:hypothetical protein
LSDNALKRPLQYSLRQFSSTRTNDFQQSQTKSLPVHVTAVDKDFVTVAFEPTNGIWTLPTIKVPQSSVSPYVREPTQVGDKGYVVPSDYYLGGVTGEGGGDANFGPRGNLTPLSYQPVSRKTYESRDYNQLTLYGGPNGVKIIQNQQPTSSTPNPPTKGIASLIPKAIMMIDQLGNISHSALKGIQQISDNLLGSLPIPSSWKGIVHIAEGILHIASSTFPTSVTGGATGGITHLTDKGITHVADNALGGLSIPSSASGILHLAEQAITHTSLGGTITHGAIGGAINLVTSSMLHVGAPSAAYQFDATTPPTPSLPTTLNLIGSLISSLNISAGGNISASGIISAGGGIFSQGGYVGNSVGGSIPAGYIGEVISANNTTGVNLPNGTTNAVSSIVLTPGNWEIQGEIWFAGTLTIAMAAINITIAIPGVSSIATARTQVQPTTSPSIIPLRTCYVNVTANKTFYLVAFCNFSSGTVSATGNIWAIRSS